MRLAIGLSALLLVVAASFFAVRTMLVSADQPALAPSSHSAAPSGKFIVHEWGTFTSFSGSDSVKLEFRPLADSDLPPFVLDRGRQAGRPNPFLKVDLQALQRMETPVTYFYTDRPLEAKVKVDFPAGLLTEFYPPVQRMLPDYKWFSQEQISYSTLDWGSVWIVPEDRVQVQVEDAELAKKMRERVLNRVLPRAVGYDHYAYARDTDSALVYVERPADKKRPALPTGAFFEKFLFYRGVGNFELPLYTKALEGDRFDVTNTGDEPIRSLFLVSVEADSLRFSTYDEVKAGETLQLTQNASPSTVDELSEAVVQKLIAAKLYEKEARAMVKTWRDSWFGEQGTRLFYLLPQKATDELLPLTIEPKPDETIRVMVGRMEIMRPEDETRIMELVKQSAADREANAKEREANAEVKPYTIPQTVLDLGRLAEPALVRIKHLAYEPATKLEADRLLSELKAARR